MKEREEKDFNRFVAAGLAAQAEIDAAAKPELPGPPMLDKARAEAAALVSIAELLEPLSEEKRLRLMAAVAILHGFDDLAVECLRKTPRR